MSDKPNSIHGKCLCQKVSVTVNQFKPHLDSCHCSMCRKWGGGPFLAIDAGTEVDFENLEPVKTYNSSEWAERGFCEHCGTHLFYRLKQNQQYIMPAGLFDDLPSMEFTAQIFVDEKPDYYDFANSTKMMTGEEVFAAFAGEK